MKNSTEETADPKAHARNIEQMLSETISHLRADLNRIEEPKAQALFETAAEVLTGLRTAFQHYKGGREEAMRA